jgi:uncharacterized protein YbjT (DUF2867 family)
MRIAVTGPTGKVGRRITQTLLGSNVELTLLCRSPEKVTGPIREGARVESGSLEDAGYVARATRDADVLFWMTVPNYASNDYREFQRRLARNAARAIRDNRIPRVINLSSAGAQIKEGAGVVSGLHDVEQTLNATDAHVLHLRPAWFFENELAQIEPIRTAGKLFGVFSGTTRMPMVATRDIAEIAAQKILETGWSGKKTLGIHGPADLSHDEVAGILSEVLGRELAYVQVPPEQLRAALVNLGMSENGANQLLEFQSAIASGLLRAEEPRTKETTTPTTFTEFAREVFRPMLAG